MLAISKWRSLLPPHLLVALSAWVSRLIMAVVQLLSIPLFIRYLGADDYALLAVAMSLQGWWLLTDMGIAYSLQNFISERRAKQADYKDLIINTAVLVAPVAVIGVIFLLLFSSSLSALVLPKGVSTDHHGSTLMAASGVLFLLMTLGNIAYRILYAEHKGYWANLLPALGSLCGLGLLLVINNTNENRLVWAIVAWNGPTALIACSAFLYLVYKAIRVSRVATVSKKTCKELLHRSSHFWLFAILSALTLQIDYIVIAKLMSKHDILLYNIATKMMAFVSFFYLAIVQAIWPVCAEALALKNWRVADQIFDRALACGAAIVIIGAGVIWGLREFVVAQLVPGQILVIPASLWVLLLIYALLRVWSDGYAMLLQSMSRLKLFLFFVPIQALLSALGQILFGKWLGVEGIVMGLIISFLLTAVWILPREYKLIKSSKHKEI